MIITFYKLSKRIPLPLHDMKYYIYLYILLIRFSTRLLNCEILSPLDLKKFNLKLIHDYFTYNFSYEISVCIHSFKLSLETDNNCHH